MSASDYIIDKWAASQWQVTFLDLAIYRTPNNPKIQYRPHIKPSSLGIPLHPSSGHPRILHESWPAAYHSRLAQNSSTKVGYLKAKQVFVNRLISFDISAQITSEIAATDAWTLARRREEVRSTALGEQPLPPPAQPQLWLVLPSHPAWWKAGLARVLANARSDPLLQALWGMSGQAAPNNPTAPLIRICWKNAVCHMFVTLRR